MLFLNKEKDIAVPFLDLMKNISFSQVLDVALETSLSAGLIGVSINRLQHSRPESIILWLTNRNGVKVQSKVTEVGEKLEIGFLVFRHVGKISFDSSYDNLPDSFKRINKIEKLQYVDRSVTVDSGLIVESTDGMELVLVAGALPFTIEINQPWASDFQPEYPLEDYHVSQMWP